MWVDSHTGTLCTELEDDEQDVAGEKVRAPESKLVRYAQACPGDLNFAIC